MCRSGESVGVVAQLEFDRLEQLRVGSIDEVFGHLAERLFGGRAQLVHDRADACFTAFSARRRRRRRGG